MASSELPRRRSPGWVRAMSSREIHAVAFRFNWERQESDLSEPQEWLYDALVSELEYRRRNARWPESRCSCELCVNPFEFDINDAGDASV